MDKQRLRVALKVLGVVKEQFPDTKQFTRGFNWWRMSERKNICGWGNFFTSLEAKS